MKKLKITNQIDILIDAYAENRFKSKYDDLSDLKDDALVTSLGTRALSIIESTEENSIYRKKAFYEDGRNVSIPKLIGILKALKHDTELTQSTTETKTNHQKLIEEIEKFKTQISFFFGNHFDSYAEDTTKAREYISKKSFRIKKIFKVLNVPTSFDGRSAPATGAFPFHYDLLDDIFNNLGTPYGVQPNQILDACNKAIGIIEDMNTADTPFDPFSTSNQNNLKAGFFQNGQYYDAQKFVLTLFKDAKTTIDIIDNYIDDSVIDLLTAKQNTAEINILTKKIPQHLKSIILTFRKQHGALNIRKTNAFHDRFIILDKKLFYHLGASIKDLGNASFMFSLMEDETLKKDVLNKWSKEWDNGTEYVST